jgi:serine/threonine-protein kinase
VGSYVIVRQLAEGGMGAVYEAEHRVTRQRRALKVVLPELGYDPEFRARFLREVTIASSVKHPNLVDTQDPIEEGGILALPMELLYGETLQHRLSRSRMLVPEVIDVLVPACHGVHAVHLANVIHRDLKPANIFLARVGEAMVPKVLDFGAARPMGDADLTQVGYVVGSPYYMAPEQAEGRTDLDPRVDVFAMGVIAFQCLTGRRPYEADSPQSAVVKLLQAESFPRPGELDHSVPRAIENVVMKALAYDRDHRYGSLAELAEALTEAAFDGGDVTTSPAVGAQQQWGVEATVIRELPDPPPSGRLPPVEPPSIGSGVRVSGSGVMAPIAAPPPGEPTGVYAPSGSHGGSFGVQSGSFGPASGSFGVQSGSYGPPSGSYGAPSVVQPGPPSSVIVSPSSFPPAATPSLSAPPPPSATGAFAVAPPPMAAPAPRSPSRQQIAIGVSVLVVVAAALGWALAPDEPAPVVIAPPIVAPAPAPIAAPSPPPIYAPPSVVAPLPAPLPSLDPVGGPVIVSPPPPPVTYVAPPPPPTEVAAPEPHSSGTRRGTHHGGSRSSGSSHRSGSGARTGTSRRWIE